MTTMIFTTVFVYCLCALVAVLQSTSPDSTFLASLASALNISTLSAFSKALHLAGLAPRPTLPSPLVDMSVEPLLDHKLINHTTTDYSYLDSALPVDLEDSFSVNLSRDYLRLTATGLIILFGLILLCTSHTPYRATKPKNPSLTLAVQVVEADTTTLTGNVICYPPIQNTLRTVYPPADSALLSGFALASPLALVLDPSALCYSDALENSPQDLATPSIYEHLFLTPGDPLFELITDPLDLDEQLSNIFVANAAGYADIELGDGFKMFAPFDSDEVHVLDTHAQEAEAWQTFLWDDDENESEDDEHFDEDHG
ncbi:hypothetical protein BN946_scf185042.g76 [Trametes cinnabarina]|uniref:Uncharacterized protein n=1 Tax=Pycnoporus cinnabarinus TaxID=5643 RepID=A0A060SA58_PYCCI|nr:hypothetical protein BN946_scf185042.g76 [Trametes cinnabarina]